MLSVTETTWFDSLKAIVLENDVLEVVLLPERGAEIHRIRHRVTGLDYLYLREPDITRFQADVKAGSIGEPEDYFFNGMYTMFPNAANPADSVHGHKYEFHGDVRHVAWDYRIAYGEPGTPIYMSATSRNMPLGIERVFRLEGTRITIADQVVYRGEAGEALPYIYGLHPYHGYPLFDEDTTIKIGEEIILPNRDEQFMRMDDVPATGSIEIYNEKLATGLRLSYDPQQLPYVWVWLHFNPPNEPMYVGALLPCSNVWSGGIEKALELDTARWLSPGEQHPFSWQIEVI